MLNTYPVTGRHRRQVGRIFLQCFCRQCFLYLNLYIFLPNSDTTKRVSSNEIDFHMNYLIINT